MPPAKTPATRRASRPATSSARTQPISREEVEQAAARFDQVLEEATQVLQTMRQNLGRNAGTAYKDVATALKSLRKDARTTNRTLMKDVDKLRGSLAKATPSRLTAPASATRGGAARGTGARSSSARSGTARAGAARTGAARKPAAAKGRAAGSGAGAARSAAKPKAATTRARAAGGGKAAASPRGAASGSRGAASGSRSAAKTGGARGGGTARSRSKRG